MLQYDKNKTVRDYVLDLYEIFGRMQDSGKL